MIVVWEKIGCINHIQLEGVIVFHEKRPFTSALLMIKNTITICFILLNIPQQNTIDPYWGGVLLGVPHHIMG